MAAACGKRHVEVGAEAFAFAAILMAGVARWEAAVLMDRDCQHVAAIIEDALGAVAMVDVPIDHGDPA